MSVAFRWLLFLMIYALPTMRMERLSKGKEIRFLFSRYSFASFKMLALTALLRRKSKLANLSSSGHTADNGFRDDDALIKFP